MAAVTLALALLSLVGQSQAGPIAAAGCCVCDCPRGFRCAVGFTANVCREVCDSGGTTNGTACIGEFVNSSCAAVPQCPPERGAPALGNGALTAVAVFLAAVGIVGLRRAARRNQA